MRDIAESRRGRRFAARMALLRPRDWLKNGFVFAPLLFAGAFRDPRAVLEVAFAAALFCIASSAVYVFNDLHDIEEDRAHPRKRHSRPLASGVLAATDARWLLLVLYTILALCALRFAHLAAVLAFYIALNVVHTRVLKRLPVIDVFVVASGFVLRVYAGAVAIDVPVSSWMFVTTLSLALYLAVVKRRQELVGATPESRHVLRYYSVALLDRYALMAGTSALVFYALFVMSVRPALVPTVPLVMFGLFRYGWLVDYHSAGESPAETVLRDPPLLATIVIWAGMSSAILAGAG
ncbi:MAG: decaprenyl-phosphate phosphoribosyltransferase [Gammaproteobacteria bacterium]